MLHNPGLRQLNQRITARYHLNPFSAQDTAAYVQHRLAVAGVDRPLFTRSALRQLHRQSKGVPRLINIFCDRALLGACVTRSPMVTRRILDKAVAEVQYGHSWRKAARAGGWAALAAGLLVVALGAGWGYWEYAGRPEPPPFLASLLGLEAPPSPPAPRRRPAPGLDEEPGASPWPRPSRTNGSETCWRTANC